MAPELATPLTVDEIRDSLTPDEQIELDKPDFMEPLKLFLEGLEKMPDLKKTFKATMLDKIRQHVNQRTEIRNAISKNPDILKTQINPVVIIGMARTGTTMLQRLLASSPDFMSPMGWEIMHPCPPGRPENWRECERYQRAKASLEKLIPGGFDELLHMHEIKLEAPDECMLLLQAYFLDIGYTMSPTMEKWKNFSFYPPQENLKSAYEYYKKALQCIFYKSLKDGQLPLLKAPIHTLYLDTYRNTFPNAKFIFPYRNAREMVGSGCSIFRMVTVRIFHGLSFPRQNILQCVRTSHCDAYSAEYMHNYYASQYLAYNLSALSVQGFKIFSVNTGQKNYFL